MLYPWPRSDADPSRWPNVGRERSAQSWHETIPPDDPKYKLYQSKIGEHLFSEGLIKKKEPVQLPKGYALFLHMKIQTDGKSIRSDCYMFGSTIVQKFRSPAEFFFHADWLHDTKLGLDSHRACECKYNSQSALAQAGKSSGEPSPYGKRPTSSAPGPSKRQKVIEEKEDELQDGWVVERSLDFRSQRRYRKGELVFFRVPPDPLPRDSGLPPITHWPGLIAEIGKVVRPDTTATPHTEVLLHHIRPLGFFSTSHEASVVFTKEKILPYAVLPELYGGPDGLKKILALGAQALVHQASTDAKAGSVKAEELEQADTRVRWKADWATRMPFKEFFNMSKPHGHVVFRLGAALKMAESIAQAWTQTDKLTIPRGSDVSVEFLKAVESGAKTLYQGLWLGGERIWMDDMVRLRISHDLIPADMARPAPDAGIFLRIRLITLERTQFDPGKDTYRCMVYGDLHDLVSVPASTAAAPSSQASPQAQWSVALPPSGLATNGAATADVVEPMISRPPPGYRWRQLNAAGVEASADVLDIAGRVYGDLLDDWRNNTATPASAGAMDVDGPAVAKQNGYTAKGSVAELDALPQTVKAVMGLRTARDPQRAAGDEIVWNEDLFSIVSHAHRSVEATMEQTYLNVLHNALGVPPTPKSAVGEPVAVSAASPAPPPVQESIDSAVNGTAVALVNGNEPKPTVPAGKIAFSDAPGLLAHLKSSATASPDTASPGLSSPPLSSVAATNAAPAPVPISAPTAHLASTAPIASTHTLAVAPPDTSAIGSPDPLALPDTPTSAPLVPPA
ncbi:hypothetical protein Q5752_001231 [Cryptotrichosporon argae]